MAEEDEALSPKRMASKMLHKAKGKARKLLTGDEDYRIRDLIRRREKEPSFQQLFNKLTYTLGVLNIAVSQYFFLARPRLFWLWYSLIIPCLMLIRVREFKKRKFEYFLIDFCYFTMFFTFLYLHVMYENQLLFNVCYIYTNGPLAWAIIGDTSSPPLTTNYFPSSYTSSSYQRACIQNYRTQPSLSSSKIYSSVHALSIVSQS